MSETPQLNEAAARTPEGVIKDQATPSPSPTPTPSPQPTLSPTPSPTSSATPEAKSGDKPSVLNEAGEKPPVQQGAPEKYADFKLPEGFEADKDSLEKALPVFKELNLSQEGAQRLVDFYAETAKEAAEAPFKVWQETQEKWVNDIKADPEIGSKLDNVKVTIAKAIDGMGDAKLASDFRAAMDYTGAGNNPAFVKALYKLSLQLTEGSHVPGMNPSPFGQKAPDAAPPSAAKALYPNLP